MKQHIRMLAAICVVVLLCGFSVMAYASGGDECTEVPVETPGPGKGFSEKGNLVTRELLYDENTNMIDGVINNLPAQPPEEKKELGKVKEPPCKHRSREREER